MAVVLSESCIGCTGDCQATRCPAVVGAGNGACSEFLADPAQPLMVKSTSMWWIFAVPVIFPLLAIIKILPLTRVGWVVAAMAFGPLIVVAAVAAAAAFL